MFKIAHCNYYDPSKKVEWMKICKDFVEAVRYHIRRDEKPKIHLVLHLLEYMEQFGPTSLLVLNGNIGYVELEDNIEVKPSIHIFEHRMFMAIKVLQAVTSAITTIERLRYICGGGYFSSTSERLNIFGD